MKLDILRALRHLNKNKALGFINALGLGIGISACLVIYLIASFELSFDKFQPDGDRIYRVYTQYKSEDILKDYPGIYTGAVDAVRDHVAGIEAFTHIHSWWGTAEVVDASGQRKIFDVGNNFVFADSNYFEVFSMYKWLEGSPESSLADPYKVVLTESRAKIYFGELALDQLIGKEIIYNDSLTFSVSGVVADINENTDFSFTDFISHSTGENLGKNTPFSFTDPYTLNNGSRLFVKLAKGLDPAKIADQIKVYETRSLPEDFLLRLKLQPLSDLHLNTDLSIFAFVPRLPVQKSTIETLVALSLSLLLIAIINFINLQTAQASKRAKEVGLRKILGSSRWHLIRYFLIESFVLTLFSIILSVGIALFAFQYFKEFIPQGVALNLTSPELFLFLLFCLICVPLLAGIYPALALSSFRPSNAGKNLTSHASRTPYSLRIRKGLTIFQFSFSQILIILTLIVGLQIRYMISKDLGFSTEAIVSFRIPVGENIDKNVLKSRLAQIEGVEKICRQSQPPCGADGSNSILLAFEGEHDSQEFEQWVNVKYGDTDYISLYDIELMEGISFIESDTTNGLIVNEAYMHKLGFSTPREIIGKTASERPIIGVVKNFHTESLHATIQPTAIVFDPSKFNALGLKLTRSVESPEKFRQTLKKIESALEEIYPNEKLELSFLDDKIRLFYESEERINKLAGVATCIAILISCLGLYALSSFTAIERTKEIGIRKVMGASVSSIVILLSSEFLKLVLIAFTLSVPIAFYLGNKWLTEFAFKINLSVWIFMISGILSLILAFVTISFRTIGTAKTDPVKSLRYE